MISGKKKHVDLILTAIEFKDIKGLIFIQSLLDQSQNKAIPVIGMAEHNNEELKIEALKSGICEYLVKPIHEEELLLRIKFHLSKETKEAKRSKERPLHYQKFNSNINQEDQDLLRKLEKLIISRSYDNRISSNKISEELLISRTALFKKIKELTGYTLNNYIKEVQLQRAHELLSQNDGQTIKEIAFKVGFRDPKYFTKQFKLRFGIPPNQILKSKKEEV